MPGAHSVQDTARLRSRHRHNSAGSNRLLAGGLALRQSLQTYLKLDAYSQARCRRMRRTGMLLKELPSERAPGPPDLDAPLGPKRAGYYHERAAK